jgi:hypothetical protein
MYTATDLPVFTPMDDIKPIDPSEPLPDLIYVNKDLQPTDLTSLLESLPYHGPAWYHKVAIEFCLHTHKLTWGDLVYGITASGHIGGDEARAAVDALDAAWEGIEGIHEGDRPNKRAINNMVGVFGMAPGGTRWKSWMSFEDEGIRFNSVRSRENVHNAHSIQGLREHMAQQLLVDPSTYRPLYDLCLCTEHVRLAQCYQVLCAVYKKKLRTLPPFIAVNTDGLFFKKPREKKTAATIKAILENITFETLPALETYVRDSLGSPVEPQQKRLRTAALHPITCTFPSKTPVVRLVTPEMRQHLRGEHNLDKCSRKWVFCKEPRDWMDLSSEEALDHVAKGGSLFVRGIAGTGKSHLIREVLIPALKAQGKKVISLAKTHAAAAITEGDTVDHFSWKHVREGGTGVDVIWVDEISMLDIELLCDMNHVDFRDPPPQWILSGDFNQYLPFFNNFRGKNFFKSFEGSGLLHQLAGGARVTLTECRRSDTQLFGFYSSLIPGGARHHKSLQENVLEAQQIFHPTRARGFIQGTALAPTNLVLSHRKRVDLNARCNAADAQGREGVVQFRMEDFYDAKEREELDDHRSQPQDACFWPGLVVLSKLSNKKVKNSLLYEILGFEGDKVRLQRLAKKEEEPEVQLAKKAFFKNFRLSYALTYASVQGLTIKNLLALHDTNHPHFDARHLFVGTSRAVASDLLIVYN